MSIEVDQLATSGCQSGRDHRREPLMQLIAERVVILHLAAEAGGIEADQSREFERAGVEAVAKWRNQPRPADQVARSQGLDDDRRAGRNGVCDRHSAMPDHIERLGGFTLAIDVITCVNRPVRRAADDYAAVLFAHVRKERVLPQNPVGTFDFDHGSTGSFAGRNGVSLLGDVDTDRTPDDAAAAADAPRSFELLPPRRQLVRHPLAIAGGAGPANATAVDVAEFAGEAGIPLAPALGDCTGKV